MADYYRTAERCRAKVDKISRECRLSNQKYNDPTFNLWNFDGCLRSLSACVPPEVHDRTEEDTVVPPDSRPQSVKRVGQIFDNPEFFVDGATADDVRQGKLGDCWFISALSALCSLEPKELGNLVERICVHRDEAVGVYGFVFFRDGEWRSEVIDDKLYLTDADYKDMDEDADMNYLLKYIKEKDRAEEYRKIVQSNSEALYFARSAHKSETWVPLIEKAYAKAHGDFAAIKGGWIDDGIEDLTGGLSTFYVSEDIVDLEKFWDEGLAQVNKSFLWGCTTQKVNSMDERGMVSNHAYSIIEARTIPDGTRLLKVRNPWGDTEWEGDYSDRSKKWTEELRKLLKHEDKDDGIFWITYRDLLRHYPLLHRTRMFDASWTVAQLWTNVTVPLLSSDSYERIFKFTLSKAATTAIVLSQLDERYFEGLKGQYEFGLSFRVHKFDGDDYIHRAHHRHFQDRSINLEVDLEAGVYEVRLKITNKRYPNRPKIEDVIRLNWNVSRDKLIELCRSYDLAHAKIVAPLPKENDVETKKPLKEPKSDMESDVSNAEANPDSNIEEQKAEDSSAESVMQQPHKIPDESVEQVKVESVNAKLETKPDEGDDIKPESQGNATKQSLEERKSESPMEVTDQEHKSDSDTNSTEPVLIEKAEVRSEGEKTDKDAKTSIDDSKDSKPEDATVLPSVHNQPPGAESSATNPLASQSKDSNQPATQGDVGAEVSAKSKCPRKDTKKHDTKKETNENDKKENEEHKQEDELQKQEDHRRLHLNLDLRLDEQDSLPPSPYPHTHTTAPSVDLPPQSPKPDPNKPTEPFTSICPVGLRVYCQNAEARIEIIPPSTTPAVLEKGLMQKTEDGEGGLDVEDTIRK